MAFGWLKDAYDDTIGKLPKPVKDAGALFATGGILDSDGNVNLTGLGPGGTLTNLAVGDRIGAELDISGNPRVQSSPAGATSSNPGGAEAPAPMVAPGLTPGVADPNAGLNMMVPGVAEQYYANTANIYTAPNQSMTAHAYLAPGLAAPGSAESYASSVSDRYAAGTPAVSQSAQGAYDEFRANRPDLALDPGLGAYFDRAKQRSMEDVRRASAARGSFGSSASADREIEAMLDLEAQRALKEADYGLRRADTIRGFGETAGNLARGADISSQARSQNELDWTRGIGDIQSDAQRLGLERTGTLLDSAAGADEAWLRQLGLGADVAGQAQNFQRQRGQDFFDNTFAMGNAMSGLAGGAYEGMFADDASLMDSAIAMELGLGAEALNQDRARSDRITNNTWKIIDTATGFYSPKKGPGTGGFDF
jgi:hypothetical protein